MERKLLQFSRFDARAGSNVKVGVELR
jgi:hypothetical protein